MTSHIFAKNGYFATDDPDRELRSGDAHNPLGYWEAQPLIEANVQVFKAVGYQHHNTWLFDPISDEQAARIPAIAVVAGHRELVARYEAKTPWIWKDPRLCFTLGYWWPLMNPQTTAVLLVRRNVEQIFNSFQRMGWVKSDSDRVRIAYLTAAHIAAAESAIARLSIPHLVIKYEDFDAQPARMAQRIGDFFGLGVSASDLGYRPLLNHSSIVGRLTTQAAKGLRLLPPGLKAPLKRWLRLG